jgi:type I restriction enzyme S subunit
MSNAVPAGWSDGTLTDFCDINPRLAQRSEMNADTPVSFIKMEDVSNNAVVRNVRVAPYGQVSKGFTSFQNGDVLVAKITPCFENGKGGFVQGLRNGVGFGSTEFHVLRARKDSNSEFLYQFTNSEDFRLKGKANMTGSAGQRRVPTEYLKTLGVTFPPLLEQQKIAAILSSVDDVIEKTRVQIDKLKDLKTGMMQELLTKGIGSGGVPHTEFKDSPVGRIPEKWSVSTQGKVATFYNGRAYKLSEWEQEGTPVIRLQNLTGSGSDFYYSTMQLPEKQYCEEGDLLYMWSATFGPHIWHGPKAIYHYHIWKVVADEENITKTYLYYLLEFKTKQWKEQSTNGMGILHVTKGAMEGMELALPPLSEQHRIAQILDSVHSKLDVLIQKLRLVSDTKKALMQDLLTGKVRVNVDQKESAVA